MKERDVMNMAEEKETMNAPGKPLPCKVRTQ